MSKKPSAIPMTREAQVERASRALIVASFLSSLGFNFVFALLPLYMRDLSGPGPSTVIWSGVALAATPLAGAIASPFWGRLADRFGYRPMLLRALISSSIIIAMISLPSEPWHLVALRALAGGLGAFGGVAMGALSTWSKPEDLSRVIGRFQMAQVCGIIVGPVAGGTIAALVGIRFSALAGGAVIAMGVILVARWLHEPSDKRARLRGADQPLRPAYLWLPILTLVAVQFTDASFNPILPLLLAQDAGTTAMAAGLSGAAASFSAAAAAVGATLAGRLLRMGVQRRLMMIAMSALAFFAGCALLAPLPWGVVVLRVLCGGMAAGATVAANSAGGMLVQPGQRGAAYGWLASASMVGYAASPITAGLLAAIDLRTIMAVDAALCSVATIAWTRSQPVIKPAPYVREEVRIDRTAKIAQTPD
jgi:MFS family permease